MVKWSVQSRDRCVRGQSVRTERSRCVGTRRHLGIWGLRSEDCAFLSQHHSLHTSLRFSTNLPKNNSKVASTSTSCHLLTDRKRWPVKTPSVEQLMKGVRQDVLLNRCEMPPFWKSALAPFPPVRHSSEWHSSLWFAFLAAGSVMLRSRCVARYLTDTMKNIEQVHAGGHFELLEHKKKWF